MFTDITIGLLTTLYGPFGIAGEDGLRGAELAIAEFGGAVAGKPIVLHVEGTLGMPDDTATTAQRLIEDLGVDCLIGPLSGNEGIAVRNYAHTRPDRTFVNGASGAQELTLHYPAPNFFNFALNGVQVIAGLGRYVIEELGYRRIVTIGEDYSYPHAQIGGLTLEFQRYGGVIVDKLWVPVGEMSYAEVISAIPDNIDAVFVALGGYDAISFLLHFDDFVADKPIIGGGTTADQVILSSEGVEAAHLLGMVTCGPTADDYPAQEWRNFVTAYRAAYPGGFHYPSYYALEYYTNTKALLLALEATGGDLSDDQRALQAALADLSFVGPSGPVRLDHLRGAITNNFITVVAEDAEGRLYRRLLEVVEDVDQMMGMPEDAYLALGIFTRDNP